MTINQHDKLNDPEDVPVNGVVVSADILKDWAERLNLNGYDSTYDEDEWLQLIINSVEYEHFD